LEEFIVGVLDIYKNRVVYANQARQVKDEIIRRFSINRLVDDLDGLYRRLLAEKGVKV